MVIITRAPLDPEEVTRRVRAPADGAVVTFLGTTRDQTGGRRVLYLEYEAYIPMAEEKLQKIVRELKGRRDVSGIAIAHRIGRLEIGEISLVVAIAAPHRREAFAACQEAVDRIKRVVPIWKKEVFEGGEVWVGSEGECETPISMAAEARRES